MMTASKSRLQMLAAQQPGLQNNAESLMLQLPDTEGGSWRATSEASVEDDMDGISLGPSRKTQKGFIFMRKKTLLC
ncbi:hypothetical protein CapIbe_011218 [Capra ibex]